MFFQAPGHAPPLLPLREPFPIPWGVDPPVPCGKCLSCHTVPSEGRGWHRRIRDVTFCPPGRDFSGSVSLPAGQTYSTGLIPRFFQCLDGLDPRDGIQGVQTWSWICRAQLTCDNRRKIMTGGPANCSSTERKNIAHVGSYSLCYEMTHTSYQEKQQSWWKGWKKSNKSVFSDTIY